LCGGDGQYADTAKEQKFFGSFFQKRTAFFLKPIKPVRREPSDVRAHGAPLS
jgi:hypothetical protein